MEKEKRDPWSSRAAVLPFNLEMPLLLTVATSYHKPRPTETVPEAYACKDKIGSFSQERDVSV